MKTESAVFISVDELIKLLQHEKSKGCQKVYYQGTLISDTNGNKVILTTENQM